MTDQTPIFVLCCARSGSTLLRYVLDTHPAIAAPPELHLLLAARQLIWLFENTANTSATVGDPVDAAAYATTRVRASLGAIMDDYAQRAGKSVWAEKSVSTVDCVDMLERLFPDARILCLYRRAPDVMASCAQAGQRRQGTFGFEPYVTRSTHNAVDGLADYWLDKTQKILDAERALANPTLRITYEALVSAPGATIAYIVDFLGLPPSPGMLDSIFTTPHVVGPGDSKILTTTGIHRESLGHGAKLAMDRLSADRRTRIDALHLELGYETIGAT